MRATRDGDPDAVGGPRRIALIGAFERDNFGDILFLLLTRRALTGAATVPMSIVGADMRELADAFVHPAGHALAEADFDVVWSVGGEVGTTTVDDALTLSLDEAERSVMERSDPRDREAYIRAITADWPSMTAYVPVLAELARNRDARLVINSVGISAIGRQPEPRRAALMRSFEQPADIVVRDPESSAMLAASGIEHFLAPDMVHSIRNVPLPASPVEPGSVLIQATIRFLDAVGIDAVADAAVALADAGHRMTLFAAGTANRHDSFPAYESLARAIVRRRPGAEVDILRERRPLHLAAAIRDARLWIGTSLHGRIIASAFDVPRVGLENAKVAAYAAAWDPSMPSGVAAGDLADAARAALDSRGDAGVGEELARLADDSMQRVVRDALDI